MRLCGNWDMIATMLVCSLSCVRTSAAEPYRHIAEFRLTVSQTLAEVESVQQVILTGTVTVRMASLWSKSDIMRCPCRAAEQT